ncbi:double-stranded RNA-binding protein 1-like [Miscanthus floridulus]|uniref:double-stranded RNA-binding protein 1-like n=1 Tax=Miscanthus floridulus TaxID=154761 RepID=UPI003458962B
MELCQKRRWSRPEYRHTREGPDHAPHFHATVDVNGVRFSSPGTGMTKLKQAYHLAAKVAFDSLNALPATASVKPQVAPPPPPPPPSPHG